MDQGPPEFRIVRGSPTPDEEAAIRAAILKLWREEQIEAQRASGLSPWVLAGRAEATRSGAADFRGDPGAWRLSQRLPGLGLISARRTGRGDSR